MELSRAVNSEYGSMVWRAHSIISSLKKKSKKIHRNFLVFWNHEKIVGVYEKNSQSSFLVSEFFENQILAEWDSRKKVFAV